MTVMISGGTGFVGLNVVEALLARGEHVVVAALDDVPGPAARGFARLPGRLDAVRCDVTDEAAFAGLLRAHRVDRLFPFAAITSGAEREREAPERVIAVNLLGFISQLRAARDAGVRRVIAPASSSVYGESFFTHDLLDEATTPCVPLSIYGATKYAVECSALRLAALWDMDVTVARISAVFGPWERDSGLRDTIGPHHALARAAVARAAVVLPAAIPPYPWIYARDAAAGLLHLMALDDPPYRVFNLCSGRPWGAVITQWADALAATFPGFTWRQSAEAGEITLDLRTQFRRGHMDIARIQATGWSPRFSPPEAYADYAAWLKENPDAL